MNGNKKSQPTKNLTYDQLKEGDTVSYWDMANPYKEGKITKKCMTKYGPCITVHWIKENTTSDIHGWGYQHGLKKVN